MLMPANIITLHTLIIYLSDFDQGGSDDGRLVAHYCRFFAHPPLSDEEIVTTTAGAALHRHDDASKDEDYGNQRVSMILRSSNNIICWPDFSHFVI